MIALLLAAAFAQQASPMSDAQFCRILTRLAADTNAIAPRMLDRTTRLDNVELSCATRSVAFNKTLLLRETNMRPGWRAGVQAELSRMFCSNTVFREMARRGWRFGQNFAVEGGEPLIQVAIC